VQDHEAIIRDHKDHEEIIMSKIRQNSSKSPVVFSDAVVTVIESAPSELWWNHLCRSDFTSRGGIISTEESWRSVLGYMFNRAIDSRPDSLDTHNDHRGYQAP